jgi:hypothetical protein
MKKKAENQKHAKIASRSIVGRVGFLLLFGEVACFIEYLIILPVLLTPERTNTFLTACCLDSHKQAVRLALTDTTRSELFAQHSSDSSRHVPPLAHVRTSTSVGWVGLPLPNSIDLMLDCVRAPRTLPLRISRISPCVASGSVALYPQVKPSPIVCVGTTTANFTESIPALDTMSMPPSGPHSGGANAMPYGAASRPPLRTRRSSLPLVSNAFTNPSPCARERSPNRSIHR